MRSVEVIDNTMTAEEDPPASSSEATGIQEEKSSEESQQSAQESLPTTSNRPPDRPASSSSTDPHAADEDWNISSAFEDSIGRPTRDALHTFFYPPDRSNHEEEPDAPPPEEHTPTSFEQHFRQQESDDQLFVERFWTAYDDIIILSLFTQIGIVFRLASATWFEIFDGVFNNESALFTMLPLNCLSCFIMGMLCSGERLMEIITTRFSPPQLQQERRTEDEEDEEDMASPESDGVLRRRRRKRQKQEYFHSWQPPVHLNEELRDVQLLALERRIRQSKCLLLFPVRQEDIDVMEHYFAEGYKRNEAFVEGGSEHDLALTEEGRGILTPPRPRRPKRVRPPQSADDPLAEATPPPLPLEIEDEEPERQIEEANSPVSDATPYPLEQGTDINQIIQATSANVTENISRLRRVNLADGWDVGTTPEAMSDDLLLGLRDGFCGALSSFSSWNSTMVNLMKDGKIGEAFVGYMIGLQLPIVAYRFGQHVSVYLFIWRARHQKRRDERRGYGIRISMNEDSERDEDDEPNDADDPDDPTRQHEANAKVQLPSIRAVATSLFIMALVTQCTSLSFYADPADQQLALSLLFSPLGVLARWRLSKYNRWRPSFPMGTFTANILACALSGSLGQLLAGNPGPRERVALVSFVNGFGGTLSSLATFVVEILAGIDPILFRFDGMVYGVLSIFWATVVGFVFSTSLDWADETSSTAAAVAVTDDAVINNSTRFLFGW